MKEVTQTIPAVKSTVSKTTHVITFVDGVVITLEGSNTVATRKAAYLKAIASIPVPTPVPTPTYDYSKTYRYGLVTHAYKMGLAKPGFVSSFPDQKGGSALTYSGSDTPTLGLPYITNDGLLFLQNQKNVFYVANIKGDGNHPDINNAVYPREVWMVLYKPDYFMFEKFLDGDFYMGDLGSSTADIRFTNDGTVPTFTNMKIPVNQLSIWRIRLTALSNSSITNMVNVDFWLNGVKQSSNGQVQTWFRKFYCASLGTDTNNEYFGVAELFHTPVLTDVQAAQITTELQAEYKPLNLPIATDLSYTSQNGNVTVSYKYSGSIAEGKPATIRWVNMAKGPESSVYMPQYDGKWTIPAINSCRAEITVYDAQGGYFDIPSTKYFQF
jgi:hypothetical protein